MLATATQVVFFSAWRTVQLLAQAYVPFKQARPLAVSRQGNQHVFMAQADAAGQVSADAQLLSIATAIFSARDHAWLRMSALSWRFCSCDSDRCG